MIEEITKQWSSFLSSTIKDVGLIFLRIKHHEGPTIPKELMEEIVKMSCERADEFVNLVVDTEIVAEIEKDKRKKELLKKREDTRKKRAAYFQPLVEETPKPARQSEEEEQP